MASCATAVGCWLGERAESVAAGSARLGANAAVVWAVASCGAAMPRGGCLPRRHQGRERAGDVVELAVPGGLCFVQADVLAGPRPRRFRVRACTRCYCVCFAVCLRGAGERGVVLQLLL